MSSIDRKELDAVSNHISNIPSIGAVYAPVLVEHCRALLAEVERALKAEDATLPVDHEADAMFDAVQPSLGTPVPPERRIRRQADVDAAFARGVAAMREALAEWAAMAFTKTLTVGDIRAYPDPEDKQ
jgi:hypothetical protein